MPAFANPFRFETPADRWSFTDRGDLLPRIDVLMAGQGRRGLLHGRRGMGKTSLILHCAQHHAGAVIIVDLSTVANMDEIARKLVTQAPKLRPSLIKRGLDLIQRYFRGLTLTDGHVSLAGTLRTVDEVATSLESALTMLDELAAVLDLPLTVCFDEFQEIRSIAGDRAEWKIRGYTQPLTHLNFIFAGSDHRMLRWMSEPNAAFYKQLQPIGVGPIDSAHLGNWINERAKRGGLGHDANFGPEVVAAAQPCTRDVVRLASVAFDLAARRPKNRSILVANAFDQIALRDLHDEFVTIWRFLNETQRLVLRAASADRVLTAADTLRSLGIRAPSTAQRAIGSLIDHQILTRADDRVIFDSPFFKRWVLGHS